MVAREGEAMANIIATRKVLEAATSQIERDIAHLRDLSRSLTKTRQALHRANLAASDSLRFLGTARASSGGMMELAHARGRARLKQLAPQRSKGDRTTTIPF